MATAIFPLPCNSEKRSKSSGSLVKLPLSSVTASVRTGAGTVSPVTPVISMRASSTEMPFRSLRVKETFPSVRAPWVSVSAAAPEMAGASRSIQSTLTGIWVSLPSRSLAMSSRSAFSVTVTR